MHWGGFGNVSTHRHHIGRTHSTSRAITSLSTNLWRLFLSSAEFSKNHMHVTRNQARNEGGGMSGRSGLWTDDELANRKKRSSLSSSLSLSLFRAGRQTDVDFRTAQPTTFCQRKLSLRVPLGGGRDCDRGARAFSSARSLALCYTLFLAPNIF